MPCTMPATKDAQLSCPYSVEIHTTHTPARTRPHTVPQKWRVSEKAMPGKEASVGTTKRNQAEPEAHTACNVRSDAGNVYWKLEDQVK
jgi:hypothetical protein